MVKNGTKNLLGKDTAQSLNVLRIGINISQINVHSEFLKIPINETVKPVVQPYRRTPIPLEIKVNKK